MRAAVLLLVALLSACTTATVRPETPGQLYYALKADYELLLTTAKAYRDDCEARAAAFRMGCEAHVAELQRIDREVIWPALLDAKAALDKGDDTALAAANLALRAAVRQLETYILVNEIDLGRSSGLGPPAFAVLLHRPGRTVT